MWVLNRDENAVQFLLGRIPLRVEDFRPDRMKMKVSIDPAPAVGWAKLVDLKARISLENLFGAAAGDRVVKGESHFIRRIFVLTHGKNSSSTILPKTAITRSQVEPFR